MSDKEEDSLSDKVIDGGVEFLGDRIKSWIKGSFREMLLIAFGSLSAGVVLDYFSTPQGIVVAVVTSVPVTIACVLTWQSYFQKKTAVPLPAENPELPKFINDSVQADFRDLVRALDNAKSGEKLFDLSTFGCWEKFIKEHKNYYEKHNRDEVPHHLNGSGDTNTLLTLQQWWFDSIKPKLVLAETGNVEAVKLAVNSLWQFSIQLHKFYEDIFIRTFAIDPEDKLNLLGAFHKVYKDSIEPVEKAIKPLRGDYGLTWEDYGEIDDKFKELRSSARERQKQLLEGAWSRDGQRRVV